MRTFFTSDTHFSHANIIRYSNRPFKDVQEMNEQLILKWNNVVTPEDEVFHLGDFAFGDWLVASKIKDRLNGKVYLMKGNHEKPALQFKDKFEWVRDYMEITVEGQRIILMHYPITSWNHMSRGAWMLHGHCHSNMAVSKFKTMDVGVDNPLCGYTPFSFEDIKAYMNNQVIGDIDHHGKK